MVAQYDGSATRSDSSVAVKAGSVGWMAVAPCPVSRPLPKFFHYAEHGQMAYAPPLPPEPFRIYDKVDGTLGIKFAYGETWQVASKGSFVPGQARWAQRRVDD